MLCSMAIKINVTPKDQIALNHILETAGYRGQRRKFHCTVGFIEKIIPAEEAASLGETIIYALQEFVDLNPPLYEVDTAVHLFDRVLAFLPSLSSQESLKEINLWLLHKVQEISENRWGLNQESLPENYIPHLTLWHTHRPDLRFKKLEEFAATHPIYHLTDTAYIIFN